MENQARELLGKMYVDEFKFYEQKEKELYDIIERLNKYIIVTKDLGGIISKDETMEEIFKTLSEKYDKEE